jgi:hypothetical protein
VISQNRFFRYIYAGGKIMGQMTAEQAAEWGKTLSFEKVWAMFAETDRKMAESRAETERFLKESRAETDRIIAESRAETERVIAKMSKSIERVSENLGGVNRSLGELIETLIAARLWEKFPEHGFVRPYRRVPVFDETSRPMTEIDILLSNTDKVMAVEVKRELDDTDEVKRHIKRMELIRAYPPAEVVNKALFGAMAGGLVSAKAARYAYEAGFYVLELTGETVDLIPPPAGFKPGTW